MKQSRALIICNGIVYGTPAGFETTNMNAVRSFLRSVRPSAAPDLDDLDEVEVWELNDIRVLTREELEERERLEQ